MEATLENTNVIQGVLGRKDRREFTVGQVNGDISIYGRLQTGQASNSPLATALTKEGLKAKVIVLGLASDKLSDALHAIDSFDLTTLN